MGGRLEKRVANILLPGEGFTSLVFGLVPPLTCLKCCRER
jgi:hypothetical protein